MRLQESHGSSTPQSPSPSPKEFEDAIKECVDGDCGRVREMIGIAKLGEYGTFMLMRAGIAALLERSLSRHKIRKVVAVTDGHKFKCLMELNNILEFRLASDFWPKTISDAYWQFTSLVTLKLPFIIKSKFDPPNDACSAFSDESLCHMFISGYLIAESAKSNPYRFKYMGTTHPASVALLLGITNYLAMKQITTKAYIREKVNAVHFIFSDLPEDVERFLENVWGDPVALTKLSDGEFLAFIAGLLAGDGYIVWSRGDVEVALTGDLRKEKSLYAVVQGELERRLGVDPYLREDYNDNTTRLIVQNDDALKLLRLLPPIIEPLKELRRQLLLKRGMIGVSTAKKIFELLGDGKRKGERGIRKLQSHQAVRFLTILLRLGLVKLKPEEGHYTLETPQTHVSGFIRDDQLSRAPQGCQDVGLRRTYRAVRVCRCPNR